MAQKVILTKGLPGSGKSTWAKEMVNKSPGQYKRVNKDDLRAMIDNGKWSKKNEEFVLKVRNFIVEEALESGLHVIVDDTNLHPKHKTEMKRIAANYGAIVVIQDFTDVPLEVCIERDLKRPNSVGSKIIQKMHNEFLAKGVEPVGYDESLPDCYIFDIDGTLALRGNRGQYEWGKVGVDSVNKPVERVYTELRMANANDPETKFFIFSGRDGVCQPETERWLYTHGIFYDGLFMRGVGDNRKDTVIKQELYETHIKNQYNVLGIFDDRNQVVEMWRSLGLPCFQVAEGDF